MKRGIFILAFIIIGFLVGGTSFAWGSWQYVESEAETTTSSPSYVTKVQQVVNSSGYHLILASWELGINDTAAFVLSRLVHNATAIGDFSLQTFDGSTRYRTFAYHSILSLTSGDSIKISFATNNALYAARIKRARILLIPLSGMEYYTGTGLSVMNLGTGWSNAASTSVTPATAGDYLVVASVDIRPNSGVASGECRVQLDGSTTWDLMTLEGKSVSDRVPYFSARMVHLSASAHTLRLQVRSDEGTAADIYSPRISVIKLTKILNDFGQGEQLAEDSTTNGADNWVNRLSQVHHPFQPGRYLVLGSSFVKSLPDTSVIPEQRWTVGDQEENKFLGIMKDSTDFLSFVGFKVFNWNSAPETLKVDYGKYSSGSEWVHIRDARVMAISEQLWSGFPVLDSIGPKGLVEGDTLNFRIYAKDPDADPITLSAVNVPINAIFTDSGNGAGSLAFTPAFNQTGVYNLIIIASDTTAKADSEMVQITITEWGNHPPELDSIKSKSLGEGDTLSFWIHATDLDLDSLILTALNIPTNAVFVDSGNGSGSFIFTPDFTQSSIYNVTFKSIDTLGGVDSEVVAITVTNVIRPPELEVIGSKNVDEGVNLSFRIHATDPDGDSIILNAVNVPANATFIDSGNGAGSLVFDPDYTQAGVYPVTFIASDTFLAADSEIVQITVNNVNRNPVLDLIGAKSLTEGDTLRFIIHATDPDLDSLILNALNLPANAVFVDSGNGSGSLIFTPGFTQSGIYDVTFRAADTLGGLDSEVVPITVTEWGNHAPELVSIGAKSVSEGDTLEFGVHAADLDADSIILSALNLPANAVFVDSGNGSGSLIFTPDFTQSGIYDVTFRAADTLGGLDSEVVQITVTEWGNHAPELVSIGAKSVSEGDALEFGIHATDLDADSLILTVLNLPTNAVFVDSGNGSGSLIFTPDFTQSGIYDVTFRTSDILGGLDSEVVQITVTNVVRAPVLDAIGPKAMDEAGNLSFRIHAIDPDGDSVILNAVEVPSNAAFIDSGNGAGSFVFNPDYTQSGIHNVTFVASDTFPAADSEVVQITVNNVNRDPVLDAIGSKSLAEGDTLRIRIHAADLDADSIILSALNLPANAVFVDSGNGSGSFIFTPDFTQSGIYDVTIKAADTLGGLDSEVVTITMTNVIRPPVLEAIGSKNVDEGSNLSFRVYATDPDGDSVILNAVDVPANSAFIDSGNGAGSFVFNPDYAQSGIYTVTFVASDTFLAADSEVVQITVTNVVRAPVLDAIGPKAMDEAGNLSFRIHAIDPDGDSVILNAVDVPSNAAFIDSGNGAGSFVFNPDYTQSGIHNVTFVASDTFLAADSEVVQITVTNVVRAPVLDAIGPKAVDEAENLSFRIHAIDPDGDSVILNAVDVPANAAFIDSGNGAGSFVFNPDYTQSGIHNVTFVASDTFPAADSEVVQITVNNVNRDPVLDAIGSKSLAEGDTLRIRIHATDLDADSLILTALNAPVNAVFVDSGNGSGSFIFTPDFTQSGIYDVTIKAADTFGGADSEVVQITVSNVNRTPVLASIGSKTVDEAQTLQFRISGTDPDGDSVHFSALDIPTNAIFVDSGNGAGSFTFNPNYNQAGLYYVTFIASDRSLADSEVVSITVNNTNRAPVLNPVGPRTVIEGGHLAFLINSSDPDGDAIVLSAQNLPNHSSLIDSGNGKGSFKLDPDYTQSGTYYVTFKASDFSLVDSEVVQITVIDAGNQAPVLDSIGPKTIAEAETLNFRVRATDPDGNNPALFVRNNPTNSTFVDSGNGSGSFRFIPSYQQAGVYLVSFVTTDGVLQDSERVQITVTNTDRPPVLETIGPKSVNEGDSLIFRVHATDPDNDPVVLSVVNLPAHASFADSGNGAGSYKFNPSYAQSGIYNVIFKASAGAQADSEVVQITVNDAGNHAPVLSSIGTKLVNEGQNLSFRVSATDIDEDSIILSAVDVPVNATFVDSGNGAGSFVFDPDYSQAGPYYVTFIASDGVAADSEIVPVTVNNVDRPPVLDSIGSRVLQESETLAFRISASDPDGDSLTLTARNVPLHATFTDSGNGTGAFTFTPDFTQSGIYNVTFVASAGSLVDSELVAITVTNFGNHAPVLDSIGPKMVTEGSQLQFRIQASDLDMNPITLAALNVPANAVFVDSGNGAGSFLFDPSFTQSGVYHITFIATDASLADSEVVDITVADFGNHVPVLDAIGSKIVVEGSNLQFRIHSTDSDLDSIILQALNVPLNATFVDSGNGAGSFVFIPDFTQSGNYSITFIASDGSAADSEVVQITVTEVGNQVPILDAIGAKAVVEGSTLQFRIYAIDLDLDSIILQATNVPANGVLVDSGNGAGSFVFTPSYAQAGIYYVTFKAQDTSGGLDSEVVQISVGDFGNRAPVLEAIGPQNMLEGETLSLRIAAQDPDLDPIVFLALDIPANGTLVDSGNGAGVFVFTPGFVQSGIYEVTFIASDGFLADSEKVEITVAETGNHLPVLDSIGPQTVMEGGSLALRIHASDVDLDPLFLRAIGNPRNAVFEDSGNGAGLFVFTPDFTQSGLYSVTFIVDDIFSTTDSEIVEISVIEAGNHAPILDPVGPKSISEKTTLSFRIHASDLDLGHIDLSALNVPSHASLVDSGNGAGSFTFTPDSSQSGIYQVTFISADASLADSEVVEITVTEWANHTPVLDSIGPQTVPEGDSLIFTVTASDSDGTNPVLAASNVPDRATFVDNHNGHGLFKFYPSFYQAGIETVTFTAIDMSNPPPLSDLERVVITILDVNQPPVIDSIGPRTIQAGQTLNIRVVGRDSTDPDGGPLHLSAIDLPVYSTFHDSGGGVGGFTFTPDYSQVGVDTVTFFCTDEGTPPLSGYKKVEITVTAGANRPPVLDAIGFKMVTEGATLRFRVHASDPDGTTPLLYTNQPLPQNASFVDSANGAGSFLFTPSYTQSGLYQITFYASDGQLNDYEQVMIQVVEAGNQAPILDSIGPQNLLEGDSLKLWIHAVDPEGNTITLSLTNNPVNSSLADSGNGSGAFRFKPSYMQSGIYTLNFKATDSFGKADSELVQITVIEAGNQPPVLDSIGPKSVTERQWLTFAVTASDPDGNTPTLRAFSLPPTASFTDNHNGTGSFVYRPTFYEQGVYNTRFEAVDSVDTLLRGWRIVQITVIDSNQYPDVTVYPDSFPRPWNIREGQTCQFRIIGTDPDSTFPIPHITPLPNHAVLVDSGNGVGLFTFTPGYNQGAPWPRPVVYAESIFVVDRYFPDDTTWLTHVFNIQVSDVPEPPNLVPINDTTMVEGQTLNIRVVTSSTVDIPSLQALGRPNNATFVDSGNGRGAFRFTPDFTQDSTYFVRFVALSRGLADTEAVYITVTEWGNHAPVLDSIRSKTIGEEQTLSFRVHALDLDQEEIILTTRNMPTNAGFVDSGNGSGSFVFHPSWQQAGTYYVTFLATDVNAAIDSEVVQITVVNVDQAPVLDLIGSKTVSEGQTLQFRVHATDVDSDSLVLTAAPLPLHASFHDSSNGAGVFTFTPSYFQAGIYTVIFTASDLNSSDMEMVSITVTNVPQPPNLDSIGSKVVTEGDSLKFRIHAIDPDGDPITLSVRDHPANSSLVDSGNGSGAFRFKPGYLQAGLYLVTFKATDNTGKADSELVQITVNEAGNQQPDLIAPLPDSTEPAVGDTFRLHVFATDPDGPSLTLSVINAPNHSTFVDSGNGGGVFKFNPDSTQTDSVYHTIFIASDGLLADSVKVTMHVVSYVRGDANRDGNIDLGDLVYLLNYLYKGGPPPEPLAAGDANCNDEVNLGDLVYLLNYLYKNGPAPGCSK